MGSYWNVDDIGNLTNEGLIDTQAIKLPTVGGAQSLLMYYEGDQDYILETAFTGPWGEDNFNNALNFSRIGNIVTMQWAGIEPQAVTGLPVNMRSVLTVPPRFIPPNCDNLSFCVPVYNGSVDGDVINGTLNFLYNTGEPYVFFATNDLGGFVGPYCGMPPGAVSWLALFPT